MAKIIHFGAISEIDGQLHFDGFHIDAEGDDTVGYHTIYDGNTTSVTSNPHKVIDVIITGVIERLSDLREANNACTLTGVLLNRNLI